MAAETPTPPPAEPEPTPETVTVTALVDGNVLINGQSTALTAGQEVEMSKEEAAQYAHLGLVELKSGPSAQASEGSGVPKRK